MTPEEAKEWGHLDEIVESRGKADDAAASGKDKKDK